MFDSISYTRETSLVEDYVKIQGNLSVAEMIKEIVKKKIEEKVNLYQAQEDIKSFLIDKYGDNWYDRNGEAVNYIIKNEYINAERKTQPYFDKELYEFDITHAVLY